MITMVETEAMKNGTGMMASTTAATMRRTQTKVATIHLTTERPKSAARCASISGDTTMTSAVISKEMAKDRMTTRKAQTKEEMKKWTGMTANTTGRTKTGTQTKTATMRRSQTKMASTTGKMKN